jgi:hypothetical protein
MNWQIFRRGTSETWRKGRKILDRSLRSGEMISYGQLIQEKTRDFLGRLRADPKEFRDHIGLSVGTLSLYRMTVNGLALAAFRESSSCHSRLATT